MHELCQERETFLKPTEGPEKELKTALGYIEKMGIVDLLRAES